MSCPCPAKPKYVVDIKPNHALSLCAAIRKDGEWHFGADPSACYETLEYRVDVDAASASLSCSFATGEKVTESYTVDQNGVCVVLEGEGEIGFALPAFCFDGEKEAEIRLDGNALTVLYEGWSCRYTANGEILDTGLVSANRNGHYRAFVAVAEKKLNVHIEILKL
jgi:hypothetical protein